MKITLNIEEKDLILNSLTPEQKELYNIMLKEVKKLLLQMYWRKIRGL